MDTAVVLPPGLVPEDQLLFAQQQIVEAQAQINALNAQLAAAQQAAQAAQEAAPAAPAAPPPPPHGAKLALPAPFRGSDEKHVQVQAWLFSLNLYFRAAGIVSERQKIDYAVCLFQGHASQWYRLQCLRSTTGEPYDTWDDLQQALEKQFTPVNSEKRARDRLATLRQTTSVRRYIQDFTNTCLEIPDLHPTEQYHRFVQGLKSDVRRELELHDLKDFDEAARIAERFDSISFAHRSTRPVGPRPSYSRPEPMELDNMNIDRRRSSAAPNPPSRLTAEDRRRLRDTNSCFYCRQPGHIMANCPLRAKNPPEKQGNGNGTNQRAR
jgi:hypothetical protein